MALAADYVISRGVCVCVCLSPFYNAVSYPVNPSLWNLYQNSVDLYSYTVYLLIYFFTVNIEMI